MAHAVVAVDQRGRRRASASTLMFGRGLIEPSLSRCDILRQAEDAVRIGAGEVGLQHQLGDLGGVGRPAGRPCSWPRRSAR